MNLEEIKAFLEQNKEDEAVKTYLNSFKVEPTLEVFKEKIKADKDFKSYLDSERDKYHAKALETWKTNNLNTMIDDEIKKRFPEKDPKDLELEKMKTEIAKMQAEKAKESLTNKALKFATEKNIPVEYIDFLIGNDEEITMSNLEKFSASYSNYIKSGIETGINERLKSGYQPPAGGSAEPGAGVDDFMSVIKDNQAKRN